MRVRGKGGGRKGGRREEERGAGGKGGRGMERRGKGRRERGAKLVLS